ncbi:unnamed protein product, partial [Ixodes pacificus]
MADSCLHVSKCSPRTSGLGSAGQAMDPDAADAPRCRATAPGTASHGVHATEDVRAASRAAAAGLRGACPATPQAPASDVVLLSEGGVASGGGAPPAGYWGNSSPSASTWVVGDGKPWATAGSVVPAVAPV